MLKGVGFNFISAIKAVRNLTSLGLKEAKDLVDASRGGCPRVIIAENVYWTQVSAYVTELQNAGCDVVLEAIPPL